MGVGCCRLTRGCVGICVCACVCVDTEEYQLVAFGCLKIAFICLPEALDWRRIWRQPPGCIVPYAR